MYRVLLIICYVCIIYGTINVHAAESEYNVHNSKIYFRFGESVIKSWFRENETAIADIDFVFSSINTQEFSKIRISGSASPEGSRHFNEQLSHNRAMALQKYLSDKFNISDSFFDINYSVSNISDSGDDRDLRYAEIVVVKKGTTHVDTIVRVADNSQSVEVEPANSKLSDYWLWGGLLLVFIIVGYLLSKVRFKIGRIGNNIESSFKIANSDYPLKTDKLNIEKKLISEDSVPSGSGGINGEQYTYGQLCHQPIIPELMQNIKNPQLKRYAKECNSRNSAKVFSMFKVQGEYCFWGLRVGPVVKTPTVSEMKQVLLKDPKTAQAVKERQVTPAMIRAVTYDLLREELGRCCGISKEEAGLAIGNQLDCAPHEDGSGYIFMVPNWAHKWFRHDGYVSKMLSELNR